MVLPVHLSVLCLRELICMLLEPGVERHSDHHADFAGILQAFFPIAIPSCTDRLLAPGWQ